ncbi:hypothetical protein B0T18DRAFT_19177 [Schizothecium vesticola]|uniref:Zn(2)-C6 fungal-type domain-containing protein n=1 Tax=Schizothecium vesticola TaxID=314040 RepID=A0AA40F9H6_9PEZI|nr:hypothetical protein B0T18DRAFT_19177 [Schizothecium vesticola]
MADDHRGGRGYPPRGNPEESHYPPPPNEDDDRKPPYQQRPPAMTLPSMSYPPPGHQPEQRYGDPRYPPDPRQPLDQRSWSSESPTNPNGYPPPPDGRYQLPPVQTAGDRPRYDDRQPYDERRQYHEQQQYYQGPPPGPGRGGPPYPPDYYQNRYPAPFQYADYPRGGPNAPQVAPPPPQQAAPRQRTSIACRYCRKRKIRCSGYANTTNGKCTNCDKLRIDCVFQPVSSNSSTAFVPVSAVPGGVPPGTPLYGAYGQPLPPTPGQGQQQRAYPPPPQDYPPSLHSPNAQYYDDRNPSRRRSRPPDEDHPLRLPPPNYPNDDDPRRRSPASNHSSDTPPIAYRQYQQGGYEQDRTPTPHKNSPGGPPPLPAQSQPPPASQIASTSNPMSLNRLMDTQGRNPNADIDKSMIGRLNRRP